MRNIHKVFRFIWLLSCFICCFPLANYAYSLRQFSNKNGLSNSAILSLHQDHQGVIWIGSCDGLNVFDGTRIQVYTPVYSSETLLSGNLINHIMEAEENVLWIQTNYGLDRLDTKHQICQSFPDFKDNNYITKSDDNELFIVKDDGYLYHYQREKRISGSWRFPQLLLNMYYPRLSMKIIFSGFSHQIMIPVATRFIKQIRE